MILTASKFNPFEPPSRSPRGPWLSPAARLAVLLILYVIARALYAVQLGH
jgi:hypothetical protein